MHSIQNVLLDLDGTLADTAPDLAHALNQVLIEQGNPPLSVEAIRPTVSQGGIAMVCFAFDIERHDQNFEFIRERFLTAYSKNIARDTRLFPGMEAVLDKLDANRIPWGIVTNKTAWLTNPLVRELELHERTNCVVSGDTVGHAKPHPAPMLHACKLLGCDPQQTVYVGDASRDIEAGKNAGMKTLAAGYGYIAEGDCAENWGADGIIQHPMEILDWLPDLQP